MAIAAEAQTTSFTYQGRLTEGGLAANGMYDFQFAVFDTDGLALTSLIPVSNVLVTNGVFTVELNFGPELFSGEERFLQVNVKKPADPEYTVLSPRQPITSSPYSIKSRNAATADDASSLGGVPATEFVQDSDPRMTDSREPNPGSGSYIQNNASATPQSLADFNISGIGTASILNATTQYNINGLRVFATPMGTSNTFAGVFAGAANGGNFNSFYGSQAGLSNSAGGGNSFFGTQAGLLNTTGIINSFFGRSAGLSNTTGNGNSFIGTSAGSQNTTGFGNTFLGTTAGLTNTSGFSNTLVGTQADVGANNLSFAAAIGADSVVSTSNTIVLGRANGLDRVEIPGTGKANIFTAATEYQINNIRVIGVGGESSGNLTSLFVGFNAGALNTNAGIFNTFVGRQSGFSNTEGESNSFFGYNAGLQNSTASNNSFFGYGSGGANTIGLDNSFFGSRAGAANTTAEKNSFFGAEAGLQNTTGSFNSFFGYVAGRANTTGTFNTFIGYTSGIRNTTGGMNAYLGHFSGSTPRNSTRVTLLGAFTDAFDNLDYATAIGANAVVTTSNTIVLGRPNGADKVVVPGLGDGGDLQLCWNAQLQIARCMSSLRFKTKIKPYIPGLQLVKSLQPITFDWTTNGKSDVGLGAEAVAAVEPLLATYDEAGRVAGVKYDRIAVVLLNAVKEQQKQIEHQQKQMEEQISLIKELVGIVCKGNPKARPCTTKEEKPDEK